MSPEAASTITTVIITIGSMVGAYMKRRHDARRLHKETNDNITECDLALRQKIDDLDKKIDQALLARLKDDDGQ